MYQEFLDENFLVTNEFKNCTTYLGHYSSLIEIAYQLGRNVILWELHEHPIPENYLKYGHLVTNSWDKVNDKFRDLNKNEFELKSKMIEYFKIETGPFRFIGESILNELEDKD